MSIPADAPHPDEAHAFINFMLQAGDRGAQLQLRLLRERQSRLAGIPRRGGAAATPAIYPDEATLAKLYTTTAGNPREQREITRIWTEVKTGQ